MTTQLPPTGLDIDHRAADGGCQTLLLVGELDIASVPALEGAVSRMCGDETTSITLDLSGLVFIDSTGLAAIVFAGKVCEKHGYEFALVPGPDSVQRLFELTGLIDVLPFRGEDPASAARADER